MIQFEDMEIRIVADTDRYKNVAFFVMFCEEKKQARCGRIIEFCDEILSSSVAFEKTTQKYNRQK